MKQRIISGVVGVCLLAVVLILHHTIVFPLAFSAIVGVILFELIRAIGGLEFKLSTGAVMSYGILSIILSSLLNEDVFGTGWQIAGIFYSVLMPVCLTLIFWDYMRHPKTFTIEQGAFMISAMILVTDSFKMLMTMNHDENHSLFYVILSLCGAWIADTGAYFSGVALGKTKLCPEISPKKTVEGFVGGLVSNMLLFILIFLFYAKGCGLGFGIMEALKSGLLGLVCAGVSVLGDLTASVIKRQKGIKDYGNIMPGHGGLMDRFDSVLFVIPAFYWCIRIFPIF
ncbi:MAG: phosphatidate cytidylyltransferase [Oscillospiraceae bacterium]|nr:phosphatidate cytidylyltransferase [Oscillospiraceae bacterium]